MKKENKQNIERLCRIFVASLSRTSALHDSIALSNLLDNAFPNANERLYAYNFCDSIIKEQIKLNEGIEDNSN